MSPLLDAAHQENYRSDSGTVIFSWQQWHEKRRLLECPRVLPWPNRGGGVHNFFTRRVVQLSHLLDLTF
ncbi:hypothetical protein BCR43DRAFT_484527 [Syncephalastrum racemosum]|uniref:Uncharacterized protein n=1 Tax=Syncephalastrum racemosum TaxID=13706 RepID=A0A1X2HKR1_SYNRA|nr:hypothetical protein BCR43DRAFT_484402 [Syncephalastrum racemosum]ORY99911.1 hypothetical protein BCR43DRAFT_484527 [Syncephalastrum racemosum]